MILLFGEVEAGLAGVGHWAWTMRVIGPPTYRLVVAKLGAGLNRKPQPPCPTSSDL